MYEDTNDISAQCDMQMPKVMNKQLKKVVGKLIWIKCFSFANIMVEKLGCFYLNNKFVEFFS